MNTTTMEQHPSVGSNNNSSSSLRLPKGDDYRAFVFCLHDRHGALLLHCTRKAHKPPHFQIPGGHLDGGEEGHVCAARELHEETGIRVDAERLQPLHLNITDDGHEYKQRLFYQLRLTDADFPKDNSGVPAMEDFGDPPILVRGPCFVDVNCIATSHLKYS